MNNVAFTIFGFDIYWYGLLIMAGLIIGIFLSTNFAKKRGYKSDFILDFVILAVPLGIIGARLFYVAFSFDEFSGRLEAIFSLRMSGLSIFGAVIGGIAAALIYSKWKKTSVWDLFDCAAPSLILAQALGRWGNFFNEEVYGGIINNPGLKIFENLALFPPAVFISSHKQWHLALFLIESVWNLITFAVLITVFHKQKEKRGIVFWLYFTMYCAVRSVLEGLRDEEFILYAGPVRISQLVSIILFALGLVMLVICIKKGGYKAVEIPDKYRLETAKGSRPEAAQDSKPEVEQEDREAGNQTENYQSENEQTENEQNNQAVDNALPDETNLSRIKKRQRRQKNGAENSISETTEKRE